MAVRDDEEPSVSPRSDRDPDADAVASARAGDRTAFDELARRHTPALLRLAQRYVKNAADAEEVAQLAWLHAFEKIGTYRGESTFRAWLFRILTNLALNHMRGIRLRRVDESVALEDVAAFTHSLETGKLVANEMWQKIERRLAELPPTQRLVFELRAFHELSFEEIGIIADSTEASAKTNYHHAVKRLRAILGTASM